jgi:hypothetical protein
MKWLGSPKSILGKAVVLIASVRSSRGLIAQLQRLTKARPTTGNTIAPLGTMHSL